MASQASKADGGVSHDAGVQPAWPAGRRCVVHMDLDCFYASVETLLNPALADKPLVVVMGLDDSGRGVVATASYAARAFGVRSALSLAAARRLCPQLIVLPVRHATYREYSARVMSVLSSLSPVMQQISIDEAFVDLRDAARSWPALEQARDIISNEIGLPCSFGIASNKLVAKIATGQGKPRGFTVVRVGDESTFLQGLPVSALWGVGPRTAARLADMRIEQLGQLASCQPSSLSEAFGHRRAWELVRNAQGIDESPLDLDRQYKSISAEQTLAGERDARAIWVLIKEMASDVAYRMQAEGLVGRTIAIKLRLEDWRSISRARTLPVAVDGPERIAAVAGELMREHWRRGSPLRLVGVRVSGLARRPPTAQLPLFEAARLGVPTA